MSVGFSIFTKVLAVMLIIAMCTAIVPSTAQSSGSDCDDEYQAIWDKLARAIVNCGSGIVGCALGIAAGGLAAWVCAGTSLSCYWAAKDVADAIIAYRNCRNQNV